MKNKICISIFKENRRDNRRTVIESIRKAQGLCDVVELRTDVIGDLDLSALVKDVDVPIMLSLRGSGDRKDFCNESWSKVIEEAVELGIDYIDVDYRCDVKIPKRDKMKLILSYHNFDETPDNLQPILEDMERQKPDFIKIATFANDVTDNLKLFDLMSANRGKLIGICMGAKGVISRVLGPKFGSPFTYVALYKGKESAPGQLTAKELIEHYNYYNINPATRIYGLIGERVDKSMGYIVQNRAFQENGMDAVYVPIEVSNSGNFFENFHRFELSGLSVTMPHKVKSIEYCDEVSDDVAKLSALNTIDVVDGKLKGYNTDTTAVVDLLKNSITQLEGLDALVIGAGGAARAAIYGLKKEGVNVTITNRSEHKGRKIAEIFDCEFCSSDELADLHADILINATPIGMSPTINAIPVDEDWLKKDMIVMDFVYNPVETRFLKVAKEKGCGTVSGLEIFLAQAKKQFEIWTSDK